MSRATERVPARKGVLVTGAAGILGEAIARRLPPGRTWGLVHRNRLEGSGVREVVADITDPRLGLSQNQYEELASDIETVVHCAALSHIGARPERVRKVNLEGTANVLQLCQVAGARLVHIGTALGPEDTEADAASTRYDWGPYLLSKREAERMVLASGVPATVARTSLIVGERSSGSIPRFQGIYALAGLLLRDRAGVLPVPAESTVDFLPRDLLAEHVVALVGSEPIQEPVMLTAGERALTAARVVDEVLAYGRDRGVVVARPRFVSPDAVDRLIRPVFLPALPARERRRFEYVIEYTKPLARMKVFESSIDDLARRFGIAQPPSLSAVLRDSLHFWGGRQRWLDRATTDPAAVR